MSAGSETNDEFLRLSAKSVSPGEVNDVIAEVWSYLCAHPELARRVQLGPEQLANSYPPFSANRDEGQFGVAETILVSVVGAIAKDSLEGVWTTYIWPKLKSRFGAKLN